MKVEIVHASISENGTVNGRPGDQTGGEVCRRELYDRKWYKVLRPRRSEVAVQIALQARYAAANNHIGYSQADRYSLYNMVSDFALDSLALVDEDCCCDCSSLVTTCVCLAGVTVPRDMWTGNEEALLLGTGEFHALDYPGANLLVGDILLARGHTAIVVAVTSEAEAAPEGPAVEFADIFGPSKAGMYRAMTQCNLRSGPGTDRKILDVLCNMDECYNYGYYSIDGRGVVWLLVLTDEGKTGWVSSRVVYKADGKQEE